MSCCGHGRSRGRRVPASSRCCGSAKLGPLPWRQCRRGTGRHGPTAAALPRRRADLRRGSGRRVALAAGDLASRWPSRCEPASGFRISPAVTTPAAPGLVNGLIHLQAARDWIAQMPLKSLSELAVTGNELAEALGKRPGPWLGNMLSALLQATASGDLLNNKQVLLLEAKRMDGHEL